MNKILECKDIGFAYGGKSVLQDVNFSVYEGDYICLLGENGTGKSTLLEGILGLKAPKSGSINIEGISRADIGYLPQFKSLEKNFPANVFEVVLSGCGNSGRLFYSAAQKKRAAESLRAVGLYDRRKSVFSSLSGGQRQRVLFARALCSAGKLLLLDEPMASLDSSTSKALYVLLKRLNEEGLTIITVSHDVSNAVADASRVLYINKSLVFSGSREEFLNSHYYCSDCEHRREEENYD